MANSIPPMFKKILREIIQSKILKQSILFYPNDCPFLSKKYFEWINVVEAQII